MKCVKCNGELRDGAKFCDLCGVAQPTGPAKCVKCGTELSDGAEFCRACGAPQSNGWSKTGPFVVISIFFGASYAVLTILDWILQVAQVRCYFYYINNYNRSYYFDALVVYFAVGFQILGILKFLSSHLGVACGSVAWYKRRKAGIIGIVLVAVFYITKIIFHWAIRPWLIRHLQ